MGVGRWLEKSQRFLAVYLSREIGSFFIELLGEV